MTRTTVGPLNGNSKIAVLRKTTGGAAKAGEKVRRATVENDVIFIHCIRKMRQMTPMGKTGGETKKSPRDVYSRRQRAGGRTRSRRQIGVAHHREPKRGVGERKRIRRRAKAERHKRLERTCGNGPMKNHIRDSVP